MACFGQNIRDVHLALCTWDASFVSFHRHGFSIHATDLGTKLVRMNTPGGYLCVKIEICNFVFFYFLFSLYKISLNCYFVDLHCKFSTVTVDICLDYCLPLHIRAVVLWWRFHR